jgi:predicted XRE-type DNA-binding protein
MPHKKTASDSMMGKISDLLSVVQDLFILQAARAGLSKAQVRAALGVDNSRVSRIWKHVKKAKKE